MHASPTAAASGPDACACEWAPGFPIRDYLFTLPAGLKLTAGTYWVAAQILGGHFSWQTIRPVSGSPSAVLSASTGSAWQTLVAAEDFSFALYGTVQHTQTITLAPVTPNPASLGSTATLNA